MDTSSSGYSEGRVAREIEQRTKRIPSDAFLWGAVAAIGLSLTARVMGRDKDSSFIGQWAPTLLILGLYNKLVKLQGSDGRSEERGQSSSRGGDAANRVGQSSGNIIH